MAAKKKTEERTTLVVGAKADQQDQYGSKLVIPYAGNRKIGGAQAAARVFDLVVHVRIHFTTMMLGTKSLDPQVCTQYLFQQVNKEQGEQSGTILTRSQMALEEFIRGKTVDILTPDKIGDWEKMSVAEREATTAALMKEMQSSSVFYRDPHSNNRPCIINYQAKGNGKANSAALRHAQNSGIAEARKEGKKIVKSIGDVAWMGSARARADMALHYFPRVIPLMWGDVNNPEPVTPVRKTERPLRAMDNNGIERVALARSEYVPAGTWCEFCIGVTKGQIFTLNHVLQILDMGFVNGIGQWRNSGHGQFTYEVLGAYDGFHPEFEHLITNETEVEVGNMDPSALLNHMPEDFLMQLSDVDDGTIAFLPKDEVEEPAQV
jgi:hypothetical protein